MGPSIHYVWASHGNREGVVVVVVVVVVALWAEMLYLSYIKYYGGVSEELESFCKILTPLESSLPHPCLGGLVWGVWVCVWGGGGGGGGGFDYLRHANRGEGVQVACKLVYLIKGRPLCIILFTLK